MNLGKTIFSQVMAYVPKYKFDKSVDEPGAYYIMDRAYGDFKRLYKINKNLGYFIVGAKNKSFITKRERLY